MLHEVKVYDAKGSLKKVISNKQVAKLHWKTLHGNFGITKSKSPSKTPRIRKRIGLIDRICDECGKTFKGKNTKTRVFCNDPCVYVDTRKLPPTEKIPCKDCEELFLPARTGLNFCHNPCTYPRWKKKQQKKYKGELDGTK